MRPRKAPFAVKRYLLEDTHSLAAATEQAYTLGQIEIRPPGHISVESRDRGGSYAVWVRFVHGKPVREYIGPAQGEAHQLAEAHLAELKLLQARAKKLRKLGFASLEHDAALVVAQLHNHGVFAGGGVLIGTRAFGIILNQLGWHATPYLGTADVDLARPRTLALATPLKSEGFIEILKETGLPFVPVIGLDRPPGPSTSFKAIGKDLKVDLLVPSRLNSKPYSTIPVPELGAHATALPFLDYLTVEPEFGLGIGRDHLVPVRVPSAGRYALHKLLVADLRSGADNPKIEKDLAQAGILIAILSQEDPDLLEQAAQALSPQMLPHVRKSLPGLAAMLEGEFPDAYARVVYLIG